MADSAILLVDNEQDSCASLSDLISDLDCSTDWTRRYSSTLVLSITGPPRRMRPRPPCGRWPLQEIVHENRLDRCE